MGNHYCIAILNPSKVRGYLERHKGFGSKITISDESTEVLETGGGLMKASWFFKDEPFLLMNADVLTDMDIQSMITEHIDSGALATIAVTHKD